MISLLILYLVLGGFMSILIGMLTSENEEEGDGEFYARGINTVFFWPLVVLFMLIEKPEE